MERRTPMRYGIALGSNLGDRLLHLKRAVRLMLDRLPGARLAAAAPVYESAPVNCPDGSGLFFNSVVELECHAQPRDLLAVLRKIEGDLGRPNHHPHRAPRTIDLDILHAEGLVMDGAELTLPHPRLAERRFVLQPLADIRPELILPGLGGTVAELLGRLSPAEPSLRLSSGDWAE